jgi:hypothetical protein
MRQKVDAWMTDKFSEHLGFPSKLTKQLPIEKNTFGIGNK